MGSEGYDVTVLHGDLPSLLLVCVVMIAMVMKYQYSNNDLHYVVGKQPTSFGVFTSAPSENEML